MEIVKTWPESVLEKVSSALESGKIIAVRQALDAIRALPRVRQGKEFRLGICRTFTIEPQLEVLHLGLALLPCCPEIIVEPLECIEQSLLDSNSSLLKASPDAVLVLWRLEELHPRLVFESESMTDDERNQAVLSVIARIESLCAQYQNVSSVPLFISTLPNLVASSGSVRDAYIPNSPRHAITRINQALVDLVVYSNRLYLFDYFMWSSREGARAFDIKLDLFARQPIANCTVMSFSSALADCFRPLLHHPAKVLALDLDNVLWGGVLGEDGIGGVKVGHDFPGNIYRRIQQFALALKNRGVLLVLLSKNEISDVEKAFLMIPDMPLKLEDFVATRVNWKEKYVNLVSISQELNLGIDSFVFVDDQEFEREQMRFHLPDVCVLEASSDPLNTLQALMQCRVFDMYRANDVDGSRSNEYIAQAQRKKAEVESEDTLSFLCSLEMNAKIFYLTEGTLQRALQMLAKTNQFNVTTRRHLEGTIRQMMSDPANSLLVMSLSDRFGDQGIVGMAIVLGDSVTKIAKVDSFLLSCRALGRGAENALWASLLSEVSAKSYFQLQAEYIQSDKNQQVANLFERFGMIRERGIMSGNSRFSLELPARSKVPEWINLVEEKTHG